MRAGAIFFLAGIMLLQRFASLPSLYWCLTVIPLLLFLLWRKQPVYWLILSFACGFSWALLHAHNRLEQHLETALISQDVLLKGRITGIPGELSRYTRFEFIVDELTYHNKKFTSPGHIQLNWYGKYLPELNPGDYWQLQVRLKPPYGTFNPGGFDYEKYLFQKGIRARGYVRHSEFNKIIDIKKKNFDLDRLRQSIFKKLKELIGNENNAPLIYALAIGERSLMSVKQWQVLRDTGTAHLMAISGLHIGLVAAIGFWLARWIWSFSGRAPLIISAQKVGAVSAVVFALTYALLAGWSIPTQRAFIMVMVVMAGLVFYRNQATSRVLAYALFAVLFYDPISVLSPGFWLSFTAVSVIAYALSGFHHSTGRFKQWGYVQWSITIGLLPLMLLLFQQISIIAPLANLWAIPLVSMLVVPLILLAVLCLFIFEPVAEHILHITVKLMDGIWWLLEQMLNWPWSTWYTSQPQWWMVTVSLLGVALFLSPKHFPARNLAVIFFLPLFFPSYDRLEEGEAGFYLLDVGQGLASVIQTKNHVLIFDTGPKLSERFDSGNRIVLPFLRQQGINKIDVLVVSHEDNDHIGGANALLGQTEVEKIMTSAPGKFTMQKSVTTCVAGMSWQWDGVDFRFLHPTPSFVAKGKKRQHRNNRSCVLRVTSSDKSILMSADIEKQAEYQLVEEYGEKLNSNVLVIPHHGSRTSSSRQFLDVVHPQLALLPAGYLNRYRLPSKDVLQKYKDRKIRVLSTALEGAMSLKLMKNQPIQITRYRRQNGRYWHYERD